MAGELETGREIGVYKLGALLGDGKVGMVYHAIDERDGEACALKIVHPEHVANAALRSRLDAGVKLMRALTHRHVVQVLASGEFERRPFVVMELVECGDLGTWSTAIGLAPPKLASNIVMQVCKGVAAAHAQNGAHGNLQPSNVLFTQRGVCKVTDFGGGLDSASDPASVGYMAPEQRTGADAADPRSDVYAIGALLYGLLTGRRPPNLYESGRRPAMLEGIDPGLAAVIQRATATLRASRYPNATEVARALHEVRKELPQDPPGTVSPGSGNMATVPPPTPRPPVSRQTPAPSSFAQTPSNIGYVMPKQEPFDRRITDAESSDAVPEYVDRSSLTPQIRDAWRNPMGTPEPAPRQPAPQTPSSAAREVSPLDTVKAAILSPFNLILVAMLTCIGLYLVIVGLAASAMHSAQTWELDARMALYEAVEAEQLVVEDLERLGHHVTPLRQALQEVRTARDEPAKMMAAARYLERLDGEVRSLGGSSSRLDATRLRVRVQRLKDHLDQHESALASWDRATARPGAGVARRLRLGPAELAPYTP